MAVYEHSYRRYAGELTPVWSRFLVLPRYALRDVFKSRLLVFFFAASVLVPLLFALFVYVSHNLERFATLLQVSADLSDVISIDGTFFATFLLAQLGFFAFWLTVFIGPGLVSRDLANNGLPLYLSRPISRGEYVLGKLAILLILLSGITWVAGLLLFFLQANLAGGSWMMDNLNIAGAILISSLLWITVIALLALALSAWVRWKVVAGLMFLMIFFLGGLFAFLVSMLFRTDWGYVFDLQRLIQIITASLLGISPPDGPPVWGCYLALAVFYALCLLLLHKKVRAYQVVS